MEHAEDTPDAKKPCKGILKTSSSFDKTGASYRKSAKFDELNVLQTYHPLDKDYGHMKIEEPKTPFNYIETNAPEPDQLDANLLAEKLRIAANTQTPAFGHDDGSDEEYLETEEEKARRVEFERRRKQHYNEYEAVRLARKLIEEEIDDLEDGLSEEELQLKAKPAKPAPELVSKDEPDQSDDTVGIVKPLCSALRAASMTGICEDPGVPPAVTPTLQLSIEKNVSEAATAAAAAAAAAGAALAAELACDMSSNKHMDTDAHGDGDESSSIRKFQEAESS